MKTSSLQSPQKDFVQNDYDGATNHSMVFKHGVNSCMLKPIGTEKLRHFLGNKLQSNFFGFKRNV